MRNSTHLDLVDLGSGVIAQAATKLATGGIAERHGVLCAEIARDSNNSSAEQALAALLHRPHGAHVHAH
jgi:hypothetical protein